MSAASSAPICPAARRSRAILSAPSAIPNAFVGLPWGGIIALVLTVIYLVARKVLTFKEAMACVPKGFIAMVPPIIILTLAVSLKAMINALGADVYVHDLMYAASAWPVQHAARRHLRRGLHSGLCLRHVAGARSAF